MSSSQEDSLKQNNKYYSLKNSRLTLCKLNNKPYRINQSYLYSKINSSKQNNKNSLQSQFNLSFSRFQPNNLIHDQKSCSPKWNALRIKTSHLIEISNTSIRGQAVSLLKKNINQSYSSHKPQSKHRKSLKQSKFVYYLSELMADVQKSKFIQNQTNFLDHFMLCMYTTKENRFNQIPKEPKKLIKVKKLQQLQQSRLMKKNKQKKILIFDLDETLIHCVRDLSNLEQKYPFQKQIKLLCNNFFTNRLQNKQNQLFRRNKELGQELRDQFKSFLLQQEKSQTKIPKASVNLTINLRPYVKQVLGRLNQNFVLGVFTAAEQNYAKQIIKILDPFCEIFSFCLSRNDCTVLSNQCLDDSQKISKPYIKDIRTINSIDLSQTLLIDNSPISYLFQTTNGLPIIPFIDDPKDDQLLKLQTFLYENILNCKDVRVVIREVFGPQHYRDSSSVKQVLKKIYHEL